MTIHLYMLILILETHNDVKNYYSYWGVSSVSIGDMLGTINSNIGEVSSVSISGMLGNKYEKDYTLTYNKN